jgi:2-polyprenyl-6-methoxyphenol hydroxylase-like FAD-dependent oxidoreductase
MASPSPEQLVVHADVAIVGYGPVGQALSALLASQGHRVCVVERHAQLYPLPRAFRFDGEAMRMFQRLGIVDEIRDELGEIDRFAWIGADGEPTVAIDLSAPHASGWRRDYLFYQPALEAALDRAARSQPTLELRRNWVCERLVQRDDRVALRIRRVSESTPGHLVPGDETATVLARYVVGADGAHSTVRDASGIGNVDLGFSEHWLVVDVRPHDMARFADLPAAAQYGDPRRPYIFVRNGARHLRWEFMLLEGDDRAAYASDPAIAWSLVADHIAPDQGELVRQTVYEFGSLVAETTRAGRVLLAGDSAHLMPPFVGEGLCAGLRDANNLAWRLDLVLRGVAGDEVLDAYASERRRQNQAAIGFSLVTGLLTSTLDPDVAAARDIAFRSGGLPPAPEMPGIGHEGCTVRSADDPLAGERAVQGVVEVDGRTGRFDDLVGPGFALVLAEGDPDELIAPELIAYITDELRGVVVSLDPSVRRGVRDADGALTAWLRGSGVAAVLSRPDAYVFGSAPEPAEAAELVRALRDAIGGGASGAPSIAEAA